MKRKRLSFVLVAMLAIAALGAGTAAATGFFNRHDSTERAVFAALADKHPQNVIFFLGDGMGTQEITAARYYQGVNNAPQRRPDAVHRFRYNLVGEARRGSELPA